MSAAAVSTAVGEDGIEVAVQTLKEIAAAQHVAEEIRVRAAETLLSYSLSAENFRPGPDAE